MLRVTDREAGGRAVGFFAHVFAVSGSRGKRANPNGKKVEDNAHAERVAELGTLRQEISEE